MKKIIILLVSIFYPVLTSNAQETSDCFQIKYLDFFGLEETSFLKLNASNADKLLTSDLQKKDIGEPVVKMNFFIPVIISQLKDYHPLCSRNADTTLYKLLTQLYFKIRKADITVLKNKTLSEQLEFLRDDFYLLVQNDSILASMMFTLDDGPFYGVSSDCVPSQDNEVFLTDFGELIICTKGQGNDISLVSKDDKILWAKKMVGNNNQLLQNISFEKEKISRTSLGYTLQMMANGERLTLFLKNDGSFRFYFRSW